jgi:hypothetical protein
MTSKFIPEVELRPILRMRSENYFKWPTKTDILQLITAAFSKSGRQTSLLSEMKMEVVLRVLEQAGGRDRHHS